MKPRMLAATALSALILAGPAMAEELRFTVWTGNQAHLDMLNGIAADFKETHPDVDVRFETIPAADYTQKLTFQLAGGNAPDLGWLMEDAAPTFAKAGVLKDVGPALKAAEGYDFDDFFGPAMGLWTDGEAVWGIPFSTSPFMVYYNKDLFDEAGVEDPLTLAEKGEWDMDKFQEVAKTIKDKTGKYGFEFKDGQGYASRQMHALMPPIRAYGGDAWADGKCLFNAPEATAAVKQLHEMVFTDGSIVPPGEQGDYFSGGSAMTINQISRASKMPEAGFNWGIAPLPTGPGGNSPVIGQAGIAVFARGDNTDLATEFLAFMTNEDNVATMAQFFPPARKSVLESEAFVESNKLIPPEQMKNVSAAISEGTVLPSHEQSPQILAAMSPRVDALWRADADVDKALQAICDAIQPRL